MVWTMFCTGRFFNYAMWPTEESGIVENYRFLRSCPLNFDENEKDDSVVGFLTAHYQKTPESGLKICPFLPISR